MMKTKKSILMLISAMLVLMMGMMVFADAGVFNPVTALSELTGQTEAQILAQRGQKTLGEIAKEANVLKAFQDKMVAAKKAILDQRVKDGKMTQAEADKAMVTIKARVEACDGTGTQGEKLGLGLGFGDGNMGGKGMGGKGHGGKGMGGRGMHTGTEAGGRGMHNGTGNGTCTTTPTNTTGTVTAPQ